MESTIYRNPQALGSALTEPAWDAMLQPWAFKSLKTQDP